MSHRTSYLNLTSTGYVAGECWLSSMYVNSTSSGAFKFYPNGAGTTTNTGLVMGGTITPVIGFHNLDNMHCTSGVTISPQAGTFDITFKILEKD
jgi:hypothetical protein